MDDSKLLELASLASGDVYSKEHNPLERDDLALRLAVKLKLAIRPLEKCVFVESDPETLLGQSQFSELEMYGSDPNAATRRAIVRAAAEIGKTMR